MTRVETLRDMAMNPRRYDQGTKRDILLDAAKELERLRQIIDSRPAINAGLPGTYIEWSQGIYQADAAAIMGSH